MHINNINSVSVRNPGVTLDPVLSFSDHVNRISRTCLYHLRQIRTIRHSLSPHADDAVNTLVHALICILGLNSLLGLAPSYLQALCTSVSTLPGCSALRSAARGLLVVPRMRGATAQSRSFAYLCPSSWNHPPHELRLELLSLSLPLFRKRLKTILFVRALGRERL